MATDPAVCPDCAGPVEADSDRLCPRCGYPLMFLETEPAPGVAPIGRKPGEHDDATVVLAAVERRPPPADADEPLAAGENRCASCGKRNPGARIRCERCGERVRRPDPVAAPPPAPAPDPPRRLPVWVMGVTAAAVVAAVVVAAVLVKQFAGPSTGLTAVERGVIEARASSTIRNEPGLVAAKTLDGDPHTAWNSDGRRLGTNQGVRLTYKFSREVRLARITVTNGTERSSTEPHRNQWIKTCTVTAGGRSWDWAMPETADPQSKTADFGPTREVVVTVTAVYPGAKYKDLSVAEVTFDERR